VATRGRLRRRRRSTVGGRARHERKTERERADIAADGAHARSAAPATALGLAISHLMTKPAFANLRFGDWSRILVGQINRGHYGFAVNGANQVRGFIGWALTTREKAEAWVEGRRALSFEDCKAGDCVVFNAWSADTRAVHRFLVEQSRNIIAGKDTVYFKRHYKNGSARPVRLAVNDFVASHVERRASASEGIGSTSAPRSAESASALR